MNPKSIAVIGASKDEKKVGYQVLDNIMKNKYKGKVYPINLKEKEILDLKAYPSIADVKADLAILVIPAEFVMDEVRKCAAAGTKNIIIISAGFSEEGGVGKLREMKVIELARKHKLNILGPNCFGIINTAGNLNATFARSRNKSGKVAFVSQSGAICAAVLDWAGGKNLGFSKFVSLGNKAVLDENDFFDYFATDKDTELVVAYLEEIRDGRKFMSAVSKLSKIKPVAILKAGQSMAGASAAMSHTGSMAGSNEAVMAGFARAGVINLTNLEEMFDLLLFYNKKRQIRNSNVAIISNAGGPMVATVDLLSKAGIELPRFSPELEAEMSKNLPSIIKIKNPLDLIGDAGADRFKSALEGILQDGSFSIILVILTPQSATEVDETAKAIAKLAEKHKDKIIFTSFIGGASVSNAKDIFSVYDIVSFDFPNKAVDIISKVIEHEKLKKELTAYRNQKPVGELRTRQEQMDYMSSLALLKKYGITVAPTSRIRHENELSKLKFPVAMKVVGKKLIHKTDKKAIALNIKSPEEALVAFKGFKHLLSEHGNYCVAQPMISGIEMIAGIKKDRSFGPIVLAGMGGIYAEVFKDVGLEVDDIDAKRAERLLKSLKMYPILQGARGQSGYDVKSAAKTIVSLARLARENDKIKEIDINPMFVTERGTFAADVRIIY